MKRRLYYSMRTGKNPDALQLDLSILRKLFYDLYEDFAAKGYFQEAFGYYCVDAGEVPGTLGTKFEAQIARRLRKMNLWPIHSRYVDYSEDDLFDVIEFLFDCISKPIPRDGDFHSFSNCGWHYSKFDQVAGQREFREQINELLEDYRDGYELSEKGEILALPDPGLDYLLQADIPDHDPENIEARISAAIFKFRRYRSSLEDRRDAIRNLADVLEFLRPQIKQVLTSKDENDLFNIANNFGIRHHNERQKTDYDQPIWYAHV